MPKKDNHCSCLRVVLFILLIFLTFPKSSYSEEITILFTGKSLGQILPLKSDKESPIGGTLNLARAIYDFHSQSKDYILVDTGNTLGPDPILKPSQGLAQIQLMNRLGYQAMAIGEMELMYGPETLEEAVKFAEFPLLSANLFHKDSDKTVLKPYSIFKVSGVTIGVIGITDPDIPLSAYGFDQFELRDPQYILYTISSELKKQHHCDLVIILSNQGREKDLELASAVKDIDIILGASSRRNLSQVYNYIPQDLNQGVSLCYTTPLTTSLGMVGITLLKSSAGFELSNLTLHSKYLDKKIDLPKEFKGKLTELETFIETQIINKFEDQEAFQVGRVKPHESISVSEFVLLLMQNYSGAELAIIDRGFFGWYSRELKFTGTIDKYDVDRAVLYNDEIVLIKISGDILQDIMDRSMDLEGSSEELLFSPNCDPSSGELNGRDLKDNEEYLVVVNNYIAFKGAGYTSFSDAKIKRVYHIRIYDLVFNYLRDLQEHNKDLSLKELKKDTIKFYWKYKLGLNAELDSNYNNEDTSYYSDKFNDEKFYSWSAGINFKLIGYSYHQRMELSLQPRYRKSTTYSTDEESTTIELEDSLDGNFDYKRFLTNKLFLNIFFKLENYEMIPGDDFNRHGQLFSNLGLGYEFDDDLDISIGGSSQKHIFISHSENYGGYLKINYTPDFEILDMDVEFYGYYIFQRSKKQDNITPGFLPPKTGDYHLNFEAELEFDLTDQISFDIEPKIYYQSNVNLWAWTTRASLTFDLTLGSLQ